jgi:hypothetical protein
MNTNTQNVLLKLLCAKLEQLQTEIESIEKSMASCESGAMTQKDIDFMDEMWPQLQAGRVLKAELMALLVKHDTRDSYVRPPPTTVPGPGRNIA